MNSKPQNALLFGASGLIGSHLLEQLIKDEAFSKVTLLLRKELPIQDPKVSQIVLDFNAPESWEKHFESVDVTFCSIGTTRNKTPDLTAYRKIDFDIPVNAIHIAEKAKVGKFMLVSSVGADAKSKNFYLKIKGEVEEILLKSKIENKGIFQPSLLLGKRKEKRTGEAIARAIVPLFNFLLPKKYKAVQASEVAREMIQRSKM